MARNPSADDRSRSLPQLYQPRFPKAVRRLQVAAPCFAVGAQIHLTQDKSGLARHGMLGRLFSSQRPAWPYRGMARLPRSRRSWPAGTGRRQLLSRIIQVEASRALDCCSRGSPGNVANVRQDAISSGPGPPTPWSALHPLHPWRPLRPWRKAALRRPRGDDQPYRLKLRA
jgi:hypothetical protein